MIHQHLSSRIEDLSAILEGDLYSDYPNRLLYATDASVYREVPMAVCRPKSANDLKVLIKFASENKIPLVPRTAGTSLAGQVVGHGIIVDFSKYMNRIIDFNPTEKWVRVQPGVILDELNIYLKPHGLFFGPETSTSNRCMIGGMVANNSCGARSMVYGSTRDHTLEIKALLSDGSEATFGKLTRDEFRKKCIENSLEGKIYRQIDEILSDKETQKEIYNQYPDPRINRRNTGYALDLLLRSNIFADQGEDFNFCRLLAGSEGSLAIFTEIKLNLVPVPPPNIALICVHMHNLEEALQANLVALAHQPVAVELIDKIVLDCTKSNITQRKNRFFIQGDPGAILVVEFAEYDPQTLHTKAQAMVAAMKSNNLGYHYPVLQGNDINRVWALRKAGLGLLSNMPGDAKPVAVIEDTAVHVAVLPQFVGELKVLLSNMNLECVYYAHIGAGEIHLRPILNLKNPSDIERFYQIARETAILVKKYHGSLSGEHGDGRLRGEFIPLMLGNKIYGLLQQIKNTWDPLNILNPGKIVDTPSMKSSLRYDSSRLTPEVKTYFRYPEADGFLRAVEKCNGSGDCRKQVSAKGVMCPSYQATTDESATTRARANILREFITNSNKKNPFDHHEIKDILDLCLSCKGCKSECPSNVDMAKYKAEFLQQYYNSNRIPFKAWLVANYNSINRIASIVPSIYNTIVSWPVLSMMIKKMAGFAPQRKLPRVSPKTLRSWAKQNLGALNANKSKTKSVVLFCDEFTNHLDSITGVNACKLLSRMGYYIILPNHTESGRAAISKGLLKSARKIADKNIEILSSFAQQKIPIIGLEPSAILSLRDEYPDLCSESLKDNAIYIAENSFLIDEFICSEAASEKIDKTLFHATPRKIYVHAHCHQKALSSASYTVEMLHLIPNQLVTEIDCGCCGMAGSFGFEKEHYDLSLAIAELKLFPAIRAAETDAIIAAPGISCRQQILEGTGRNALHPVDILFESMGKND